MPKITFQPSGKSFDVPVGGNLLQACLDSGIALSASCAGKGLCGKCRIRVVSGCIPADDRQAACLPPGLLAEGWRAACVARITGDLVLADPGSDRENDVVLSDFRVRDPCDANDFWQIERVMEPPSTGDQTDDLGRVLAGFPPSLLSGNQPCLNSLLRRLPAVLRDSRFRCRALGLGGLLLDVRALDGTRDILGLAVDIGTTTIAVALCDARGGGILSVASCANPQSRWGDDVVSRIERASGDGGALAAMRDGVVEAVENLADEACEAARAATPPLVAAVAANPTMNHLFLGIPPAGMGASPFIPVFRDRMIVSGAELGWRGAVPPLFYVIPNISAYVGGDITAGIVAHGLHQRRGATLLLDIGTNGEVALSVGGTVYACSTAAGPAFEGGGITCGMRAARGAVSRVDMGADGDLDIGVIDSSEAKGICGTGLLDAVAALLGAGVIDGTGRILDVNELKGLNLPSRLMERVRHDDAGAAIRLSPPNSRVDVSLTQRDIREFQLAKAAMAAGVRVLCAVAGVGIRDIDEILLAGGFGNYIVPRSALATGLLPEGADIGSVRSIGNSSLAGARMCLLSPGERRQAENLAKNVRYMELSGREDFQRAFTDEMLFP